MTDRRETARLLPALVYAALCTAIVSSLGMLLVPTISEVFEVPVSSAQWMLTVNLLMGAVATPVLGRLSDGPHKKQILVGALTVILAGSIIAALAPTFTIFLLGRTLQGLSYGIVPTTIALARRYLPTEKIGPGISSLSVTVSTGIGIGYPLTGIIAGTYDYRIAFWFAAAFVATAIRGELQSGAAHGRRLLRQRHLRGGPGRASGRGSEPDAHRDRPGARDQCGGLRRGAARSGGQPRDHPCGGPGRRAEGGPSR